MDIVQKSIPFPPIKLDRILRYLTYVNGRGEVSVEELKRLNIDFGRGRGDITRFLNSIGLIELRNNKVKLTGKGRILSRYCRESNCSTMFKILFNNYLCDRVLSYRVLRDVVEKIKVVDIEELYNKLNLHIRKVVPNAWINKVAYRSLLTIMINLELIERVNKQIVYIGLEEKLRKYVEDSLVKIGQELYLDLKSLSDMLGIDVDLLRNILRDIVIPIKSPKLDYELVKLRDVESVIQKLVGLRVEDIVKYID